ncbi:MAG: hypothetical protein IT165_05920 [Bryobacterales bacterium]|nr:hypothetical protein [Bryobacterales bacterium]
MGAVFFARTIREVALFETENDALFRFEFFPTHLAKYSSGIFFEDRLVRKLFDLRFLPAGAHIRRIRDKGGWATLAELTARIDVEFELEGRPHSRTLLGKALVPNVPLRPEDASRSLQNESDLYGKLGLPSAVLGAEHGVCYQIFLEPLRRQVEESVGDARASFLGQIAAFAASLDRILDQNDHRLVDEFRACHVMDGTLETPHELIDAFGTDGSVIYWNAPGNDVFGLLERTGAGRFWDALAPLMREQECASIRKIYGAYLNGQGVAPQ